MRKVILKILQEETSSIVFFKLWRHIPIEDYGAIVYLSEDASCFAERLSIKKLSDFLFGRFRIFRPLWVLEMSVPQSGQKSLRANYLQSGCIPET